MVTCRKNIARLKNLASRAMFAIIKKARRLNLDVDVKLHLFDTMVLPIALYGSEIWGHVNFEIIERLHLQFCKMLLKVKKCTPTCMVLGELGRLQACDGFLLSFILTIFLAHSFFSYFLTTFFMQFLLFNYFFTFFLHSRSSFGSFFSPILCENCPLHFNYIF